ncbi:LysE family transporter [Rhodospira trueperi]|uniref:Resistance to homoserine/threonine (RhtB) family protein n=1 Tax=Rhodospira trueperi TaxID=69960 RepID=A0A1G7BPG1_9PROT|nr:LysE family transporter [Rhodospira trueperi]SDE28984.1 resistance to homoserine/threonine (RhtB) family protein [Rhodospira trueperi]
MTGAAEPIAIDWAAWAMVAGINILAILSPGPDFAITLRNTLARGIRAGVLTAAGIATGLSVHVIYTLAGLSVLIAQSVVLFSIIKLMGAAYLIWIGIQALRARPHAEPSGDEPARPPAARGHTAFIAGFLTNVLNPKVALYFLALFTQVIDPDTSLPEKGLYGLTMMAETFLVFSTVAVLVGQPPMRRAYQRSAHWIERALGTVFIGLGVRLAFVRGVE